jgi:hypothetical protein
MKKYMLMLTICLAMMACKEGDEGTMPEPTPFEMISRTWKVQSVTVNGQADNTTDYSNYRFTFNTNQTYSFTIPDNRQGAWELIANATALTLDKGTAQEQRVEVPTLSETLLELEFTEQSEKTGTRRILYALVP